MRSFVSVSARPLRNRSLAPSLGVLCVLLGACSADTPSNSWVVRVDGIPIERSALEAALAERLEADPEASRVDLVEQELARLVEEELVLARARELGIEVSDEEVTRRIQAIDAGAAPDADPQFRKAVRRQMQIDRTVLLAVGESARATNDEIEQAFEEQRERFASPERIRVRQIVVDNAATAQRLLERLAAGADFAALAAEKSLSPEAVEGGLLPAYARGEMPEAFDAAFDLAPGALSGIVESPYGFHVFRLEERIAAREARLDDLRETIRAEIESGRIDDLRRQWIGDLRRQAQIEVNHSLLETLR